MDIPGTPISVDAWGERIELALRDSDFDAARAASDQACALATTPRDQARTILWRARCDYMTDDVEAALPLALEAAARSDALADVELQADSRTLLARIMRNAGESEAALDHALAAVRLVEAADAEKAPGLLRQQVMADMVLVLAYLSLQNLNAALDCGQRAVAGARRLGDQIVIGIALDTMACVQGTLGDAERGEGRAAESEAWFRAAIGSSTEALHIARAEGHRANEITALNNLVEAMTQVGETGQALALLETWSPPAADMLPRLRTHYQDTRGSLYLSLGRPEEARRWLEQALANSSNPLLQLNVLPDLSRALELCGEWQAALLHYKRYHELHVRLSAEKAQRSARIAAVLLDTERSRARAEMLTRRNEDLQRLSSEDPLTGLTNRRRLEELLADDSRRYCIALIDVDHFKQVNDSYSHAVGDAVLRRLADLLRQGCRGGDTPARLGGEEFVALLRTVAPAEAWAVAERLRQRVAEHDWGQIAPGLAVTVSIGVAHGGEAEGGDAMMALADRRMYIAKHGGRNQVVCQG